MLTLPETVVEEMRPELTKSEIRDIKETVKQEEQITDIEVAIEAAEAAVNDPKFSERSILESALIEIFRTEPEHYCRIREYIENEIPNLEKRIAEELAPAGYMIYTVRITGIGTLMIKLDETSVTITNIRSGEKEGYSYQRLLDIETSFIIGDVMDDHKEAWEKLTGDIYPKQKEAEKEKVAPAQPKKEQHVKTVKSVKKEEKKEEKKKGMEEDPYWKDLGKEMKEEKGAAENEAIQKDEEEKLPESQENDEIEYDEKTRTGSAVEEAGRTSRPIVEDDKESDGDLEEHRDSDRDIINDMPKSVARQRCKGWIEDIVRSAEELKRNFEYEKYEMAITNSREIEKEIFEIEKLLRSMKRRHDENMDGSDNG